MGVMVLGGVLRNSAGRHSREGGLCLNFGVAEHPETSASSHQNVIPANAGIQGLSSENA
jgi:hypothetical protein